MTIVTFLPRFSATHGAIAMTWLLTSVMPGWTVQRLSRPEATWWPSLQTK